MIHSVSEGHPKISYGRAGKNRQTIVDYKTSTTIKVQFAPRRHKYFYISRADVRNPLNFGNSPAMPAIPLSPEDLESQAVLRTNHVELHFHKAEGLLFLPRERVTFLETYIPTDSLFVPSKTRKLSQTL